MGRPREDITAWADAIEAALPGIDGCCVSGVFVYASVASTQDAAWRHRRADAGVVALASVQTAGRGQRGRRWEDGPGLTLPVSFALPTAAGGVGLAARAGLAALDACRAAAPRADVRIRWPNDVVVRAGGTDRKLAGVLVERRDAWAVIGVGINVSQSDADFRRAGVPGACSLAGVGGDGTRPWLAVRLIEAMSRWLVTGDEGVRARWAEHDAAIGTERAFIVDHERVAGTVVAIDPLDAITVRAGGSERSLPVARARSEERAVPAP